MALVLASIAPEPRAFFARFVDKDGHTLDIDIMAWGCTQEGQHVALRHADDPAVGFEAIDATAPGFVAIYHVGNPDTGLMSQARLDAKTAEVRGRMKP